MRHTRSLLILVAAVALTAAGCGGSDGPGDVPSDAVAVVGEETITKADFDSLLEQAKVSYKTQKRPFPKAGSPEYEQLKRQAMQVLVQRSQLEQRAGELDVEVSDKQVDERLKQIKKQYFKGDEKRYQTQLKQQGLSEEQLRRDLEAQLLSEALYKDVTSDVKVTDQDIQAYYKKNQKQYRQPESREVRHILVKNKKTADKIFRQLEKGGNFARLAKRYSQDPGSKAQGGKLTVAKGQTVPPFDQTAFLLGQGKISAPVKTQYGFHIIQPISAVKPAKLTPLTQVKASIRQQLLQTKKNEAMTGWLEDTREAFEDDTAYQVGYSPPQTGTTGTTTASP